MNLLEKISEMDNDLKDVIQKEDPKFVEKQIRNGILEYINNVVQNTTNRNVIKNKVGQELFSRINLSVDEGGLSNQELIVLYQIETKRESDEMKNLVNLIKQQFINIKIQNDNVNTDKKESSSKFEKEDVNTIRNVLQYLDSKLNVEGE